jgi:hypothetical protein
MGRLIPIDDVHRDNLGVRRVQPAARGGARNASLVTMLDVDGGSNEIAQAMIAGTCGDNPRKKLQNAVAISPADSPWPLPDAETRRPVTREDR